MEKPILHKMLNPNKNWLHGIHIDQNGYCWKFDEMATTHILNTMRFFKNSYDITPFKEELKKRKKCKNT